LSLVRNKAKGYENGMSINVPLCDTEWSLTQVQTISNVAATDAATPYYLVIKYA